MTSDQQYEPGRAGQVDVGVVAVGRSGAGPKMRHGTSKLARVLLPVILLAGCNGGWFREPMIHAIVVSNQTSTTLHFAVELPEGLVGTARLVRPGETSSAISYMEGAQVPRILEDGCVVGDLVALDSQGREVARHPPPLCLSDTWTITEPSASPGD